VERKQQQERKQTAGLALPVLRKTKDTETPASWQAVAGVCEKPIHEKPPAAAEGGFSFAFTFFALAPAAWRYWPRSAAPRLALALSNN
jgi:hypothetical protein